MSNSSSPQTEHTTHQAQSALIVIGMVVLLLTVGLVLIAVALAGNAATAGPAVRIVRDLLIIFVTLEAIVIGASIAIFVVQLARLVNLIKNEVEPLLDAASETVNTVRGTAQFLSKNLTEPVVAIGSTVKGLVNVMNDVETLRKAANIMSTTATSEQVDASANSELSTLNGESHVPGEHEASVKDVVAQSPQQSRHKKRKIQSKEQ
jgi:hypothetical protein